MREASYDAATLARLEDQAALIKAVFAGRDYEPVEPPVLQPAEIFLDRSGEDIRRRLYVFMDPAGRELCLRPDLTIPTARLYLASGEAGRTARYCYNGIAFRYQPPAAERPVEFMQAGVENFGDPDREQADAEVLAIAIEAVRAAGVGSFNLRLGDLSLFSAMLEALDIAPGWRSRLARQVRRPDALHDLLDRLEAGDQGESESETRALLSALAQMDEGAAREVVEDVLSLAGISPVGGRTIAEISERLLEQAGETAAPVMSPATAELIRNFLRISNAPVAALDAMRALMKDAGVDLERPLKTLERRLALMEKAGVKLGDAIFSAEFGRNLDYYRSFVFQLDTEIGGRGWAIAGGGRYDELFTDLGAAEPVPAVGCGIWTERLLAAKGEGA